MTSTDLVLMPSLHEQQEYAKALVYMPDGEISRNSLLPASYRGNPSNVLIAMGLGYALGLAPAQALYEIHVVEGRPSPSANLMAALARRAGHKVRIESHSDRCTVTLVRNDDPDFPFVAEWTMEDATRAKLAGKDNWTKYPKAMLKARAISDAVRAGASEVLLGMEYSREELEDVVTGELVDDAPAPTTGPERAREALASARAAKVPQDGAQPPQAPESAATPEPQAPDTVPNPPEPPAADPVDVVESLTGGADPEPPAMVTPRQRGEVFAAFARAGIKSDARTNAGKAERLDYMAKVIGRVVESTNDLTKNEASAVIDSLKYDAERAALAESEDVEPEGGGEG